MVNKIVLSWICDTKGDNTVAQGPIKVSTFLQIYNTNWGRREKN